MAYSSLLVLGKWQLTVVPVSDESTLSWLSRPKRLVKRLFKFSKAVPVPLLWLDLTSFWPKSFKMDGSIPNPLSWTVIRISSTSSLTSSLISLPAFLPLKACLKAFSTRTCRIKGGTKAGKSPSSTWSLAGSDQEIGLALKIGRPWHGLTPDLKWPG